jgi:Outer membrane protein beta-barrel domain
MIARVVIPGLIAAMLGAPAVAQGLFDRTPAEGGAYITGFVGAVLPDDADLGGEGTRLSVSFEDAAAYGAAVGYRLPFKYLTYLQPRLELEVSAGSVDVSGAQLTASRRTASGDASLIYVFFNSYNDVIWSEDQRIVPFFGGGFGVATIDLSLNDASSAGGATVARTSDDTTAFTTSFAAGAAWRLGGGAEIYGEARYATTYDAKFTRINEAGIGQGLKDDFSATTLTVGFRRSF